MLSTEVQLVLYYVGFGYLILLAWLSLIGDVLFARTADKRRRLSNIARTMLFAGILHPAFAFAGRDLIRQLRTPTGDEPHLRTRTLDVAVLASIGFAVIVSLALA